MDVFDFRQNLVAEYAEFTRSFTRIKADDIRAFVDAEYASQKYWPEPLVQVNPNFQPGGTVESLCDAGQLSQACAQIFRFGKSAASAGHSLPLYKHQVEATHPVQALLELTVCDPACGSGHFLLAAARRLADEVAKLRAAANGSAPTPADYRHALRDVVGHLDALFDGGWISFSDQGGILVSKQLSAAARTQLGIDPTWSIESLKGAHMGYLAYHRENQLRND